MHKFVAFNNQISLISEVNLSAISSAVLYGRGVFTTLAIYNFKPLFWEKHWQRLRFDAEKVGVSMSEYKEDELKSLLFKIIKKNKISDGRVRISVFNESPSAIWQTKSEKKTSVLIQSSELHKNRKKFSLTVSPFCVNSQSPLAGTKTCNYLEHVLALEEAKERGFDEAIRINEYGKVVSVCMANIFWFKNGNIFTPNLATGCLNGTIRSVLLENFDIDEVDVPLEELRKAQEIFLSSSGTGLSKAQFGTKEQKGGEFTKLKKEFDSYVSKSL